MEDLRCAEEVDLLMMRLPAFAAPGVYSRGDSSFKGNRYIAEEKAAA